MCNCILCRPQVPSNSTQIIWASNNSKPLSMEELKKLYMADADRWFEQGWIDYCAEKLAKNDHR